MVPPNKKKNSKDSPLTARVKTLQENVEGILKNQEKILEILEELKEAKKVEIPTPAPEKSAVFDSDKEKNPTFGKEFVLRHVFKNVSRMLKGVTYYSEEEEHFGVPWKSYVIRNKDHIGFFLYCLRKQNGQEEWAIDTWRDMRIVASTGKTHSMSFERIFQSTGEEIAWGHKEFLKWDELMKDYVVEDTITTEVHVKIKKMSGIYKKNLRNFDETMTELSDVVLVVNNQKFFISKLFLATHSSYFKILFLGQFRESEKNEIPLSGIDSDDFQNYLEVLYGDPAIDEITIEGILIVADMYDTQIVIRKCEDFLLNESEKSVKKKLEMATRYNLNKLKKMCISEVETVDEIRALLPDDLEDLDHSIIAELLKKSLSYH